MNTLSNDESLKALMTISLHCIKHVYNIDIELFQDEDVSNAYPEASDVFYAIGSDISNVNIIDFNSIEGSTALYVAVKELSGLIRMDSNQKRVHRRLAPLIKDKGCDILAKAFGLDEHALQEYVNHYKNDKGQFLFDLKILEAIHVAVHD